MNVVQKLRQIVNEVRAPGSPAKANEAWALAERLLARLPVDQRAAADACSERNAEVLDAIVARLENPEKPASAGASIPEGDLERAMRAFKKRLKVMRLADESKLGGRQLTGGRESEIDAIMPPTDFPPAVWIALAERGDLKHTGGGFYSLP